MKAFVIRYNYLKTLFVLIIFLGCALPAEAATYHVYPKNSVAIEEKNSIAGFTGWKVLPKPGDVIFLFDNKGPYKEDVIVFGLHGTAEKPIKIKAAPGNQPVIEGNIAFFNSSHIILEGLTVTGNKNAGGVQIRQNSHNIVIKNSIIKDNMVGVWIGDKAGMQNQIIGNTIYDNAVFGIAVDQVNCEAGKETLIAKNRVYKNDNHGISIIANYYIVEANEVFRNGKGVIGTSGIHVFSPSATQNVGKHNVIRHNIVYENIEIEGPDGNGIQLDHWCDRNEVYYNISFNNDGAGINVYDGCENRIYNNTLVSNGRRPMPPSWPAKADLWIGTDSTRNRTRKNEVINNIVVADNTNTYAFHVDRLTSERPMIVENNLFYHRTREDFYFWKDRGEKNIKKLNNLTGFKNNFFGDPQFQAPTPRTITDFMLKKTSPAVKRGQYLKPQRDILGNDISSEKSPNIGAVELVSP